jgi:hypothetical protein
MKHNKFETITKIFEILPEGNYKCCEYLINNCINSK